MSEYGEPAFDDLLLIAYGFARGAIHHNDDGVAWNILPKENNRLTILVGDENGLPNLTTDARRALRAYLPKEPAK